MSDDVDVTVEQLPSLGEVAIIDIREPEETAAEPLLCGHEKIPMNELLNQPEKLDRDKTYLLVCAAGVRTQYAAHAFRAAGYPRVYSLVGGHRMLNGRT